MSTASPDAPEYAGIREPEADRIDWRAVRRALGE